MHKSKTLRRLGLGAGVATVVGTMSMALMPAAAFASAPTGATLSLSKTTTNTAGVTATNSFVATNGVPAGGTITINSMASSGNPETLSGQAGDYTVTCSPSCNTGAATSNTILGTSAFAAGTATINVTTAIPVGATVTVTITKTAAVGSTGVTNPAVPSNVFFADTTTNDTTADNTNTVAITTPVSNTPTVSDVNSHTGPAIGTPTTGGETVTVTGTNFFTNGAPQTNPPAANQSPLVCLVPAGDAPGAASSIPVGAAPSCPAAVAPSSGAAPQGNGTYLAPETVEAGNPTTSQIQVQTPDVTLAATNGVATPGFAAANNATWDIVVYNFNPAANAGAGAYIGPSATSSADQFVTVPGLNFIPERGVRVADSRSGFNLPASAIPTGTSASIPLANFENSVALPDNLPVAVTALAMNVTAVAPSAPGNLEVSAINGGACPAVTTGTTSPAAATPATVNFQPPTDTGNYTIIPIPSGSLAAGSLCIGDAGASVNVVIDLTGWTTATGVGGYSSALPENPAGNGPQRETDTRAGFNRNGSGLLGPLAGGTVNTLQLFNNVAVGGQTVALNVAVTNTNAVGNLRVFPATGAANAETCPTTPPTTAVDNYVIGVDSSSFLIMHVPQDGKICLFSESSGTVNVVIDAYGTVTSTNVHALGSPFRVTDTRPSGIPVGGDTKVTASPSGSGANFVPTGAVAVIGDIADILPTGPGNLQTAPDGAALPGTATINHYPNQIRENLAIVALNPGNGAFDIFNQGSSTNATFDATAYIQ